jgi:Glycosyl hydrolases family 2, TIM barrel domain/Glycosyl hydrolases family 2, sugar binding domain/Glycosyl hydrolases family 2
VLILLTASVAFAEDAQPSTPATRSSRQLDEGWRFSCGDISGAELPAYDAQDWQVVSVPHSYDTAEVDRGHHPYRGPAWYRLNVTLRKPATDERVYLEFDAAALTAEVWLNGTLLGQHRGGFARFRFEVTQAVQEGKNLIAVRTDNRGQDDVVPLGGDYTLFGGLYRSVRLVTTRDLHIDMLDDGGPGAYVATSDVSSAGARVDWMVRVANDRDSAAQVKLRVRLFDAQHRQVSAPVQDVAVPAHQRTLTRLSVPLDHPHLWQAVTDPYLYTAHVEVDDAVSGARLDQIEVPVGIRNVRMDPNGGVLLNGRPYTVHGVNIHQSQRPGRGPAVGQPDMDEDFRIMQDMGVTGLRLVHYQHPQRTYDLADQNGVLVWTEIPLTSKSNDSDLLLNNTRQQLRELIKQNQNHPSVIAWGLGNEIYKSDAGSERLLNEMQQTAHTLDPTRPTTYAHCCGATNGPQASHTDIIAFNVYFGWYSGAFADLAPWAAKAHTQIPRKPMAISEYGAGGSIRQEEDPPKRPEPNGHWHPEQYQALYHEAAWRQIRALSFLWASFAWVGFDMPSDGRNEGDTPGFNDKGLVTYDRQTRKDAFYWYQANWSVRPMLYITSRRDVIRATPTVQLKVYSNLERTRATLNGADLGERPVVDHVALWPEVTLAPGVNHISVGATTPRGSELTDSVVWALDAPQ